MFDYSKEYHSKKIISFGFLRFIVKGFIGFGNILNDLSIEDSSKYSEKVISIVLFFIFTEPLGGMILIISGGVTSFGPPEGDCIAAQDKKIIVQREWRNIESSFMLNLVSIHINRKLFAEYHLIFC